MRFVTVPRAWRAIAAPLFVLGLAVPASAADKCHSFATGPADAKAIAGLRVIIEQQCPCASFDGSSSATKHGAYVKCAKQRIDDATDGTPLLGYTLRSQCKGELKKIFSS